MSDSGGSGRHRVRNAAGAVGEVIFGNVLLFSLLALAGILIALFFVGLSVIAPHPTGRRSPFRPRSG